MLTRLKRISGELSCDTPQVNDCPGEVPCSGFGYCDSVTYTCSCQDGYSGADCSLMTCPKGRSWFSYPTDDDFAHLAMTECSDMGKCNVDYGECECALGFEGAACQYLSCPGEAPCSDHGECLSMKLLAEAATENGAPIRAFSIRFKGRGGYLFCQFLFGPTTGVRTDLTYGATPNDALRWDFEAIRGCKCNSGYTNYDCSGQLCPYGDDPLSDYSQYNEVQLVTCDLDDDTSSIVYFTFREEVTEPLNPATLTLSELEVALEALDTIWDVKISLYVVGGDDGGNFACSTSGTDILIEFLRPTGDLPLLEASDAAFTISESAAGTPESPP